MLDFLIAYQCLYLLESELTNDIHMREADGHEASLLLAGNFNIMDDILNFYTCEIK
jgi:hypothetical protein